MLETTANFIETLKKNDWRFKEVQQLDSGNDRVCCGVNGKFTSVDVYFFFDKDGRSVTLRVFRLFAVPIDKKLQIMELMNNANKDYRWVKYYIDSESWMSIQIDAVITPETAGPVCLELMIRTLQIIDATYSNFMHEIWA